MAALARLGPRAALCGAYAVVTFLAFPQLVAGRVVDAGLVLGWLSPALLIALVDGQSPRRAAWLGFAAGLLAHSAILHWIYVVTVVYGHAPAAVGVVAPVALAAYIAAFSGLFGWGYAWLAARGAGHPLSAALLWTALDHLRSFALTGFPWATLGYAQHENAALLGVVTVTGVYGLSFVTVLGGAALTRLVRELSASRRASAGTLSALVAVLAFLPLGVGLTPPAPAPDAPTVRIAALQGNIDQGVKWSPEWIDRTLGIYEDLSRRAVAEGAEWIVWPETAVPGGLEPDSSTWLRIERLARETGAVLVVGAVGLERDPQGRVSAFYDSAYVFDADGQGRGRYDKSHLVPFGEYVPFRAWFGRFFGAVARGIAALDVSAGPGPRALALSHGSGGEVSVGIPICYELLFPDLMRRFVRDGSRVLLAITNDAWYGRTGAPHQFLAITALRAAETGTWVVRAANTGVSAIIDERGEVRRRTEIFERGFVVGDVPLRASDRGPTFYTRYGDVFAWSCWLGLAGVAFRARGSRLRASETRDE
ncbi:MAG: apolipoprotein N-acyltransferase [Proteobacteria bacterium]|nr:apolipoprotein N-acyltransferase [Pseudomonadota bacterium]